MHTPLSASRDAPFQTTILDRSRPVPSEVSTPAAAAHPPTDSPPTQVISTEINFLPAQPSKTTTSKPLELAYELQGGQSAQ